ncbi:MAG: serine protease [Verrucomicrobia bacterium]|nr:serine protease [Verrucomicrobiota bacterium]
MHPKPTARPCVAPIQFFCHDHGPLSLPTLEIEGGTVLLFELDQNRYVITARHVWDGFIALADKSAGKSHAAFVIAGKFLPLKRDEFPITDGDSDIVVLTPEWVKAGIDGYDFYNGGTASVAKGETVSVWGYPGAKRVLKDGEVKCPLEQIGGNATALFDGRFKFVAETSYELGGFSGAPVFRADGTLVGIVSQGGSGYGIVTCCDLQSVMDKLRSRSRCDFL